MSETHDRIPISTSLGVPPDSTDADDSKIADKKRLLYISVFAVAVAVIISALAKLLVYLINLITNISFHQKFSVAPASQHDHGLGLLIIVVPVIGGLIVGVMALYGSKAIRGHGIPEAMEQILTNGSRIRPSLIYLKPLSAAISIGTGGPFGAEGPIIATGGALGSTVGQLFRISAYERKILLAAGATAGMSAIFGSPVAAICLAIELLLFEFSARSIIPVALACITGAAGHHLLFEAGPVFLSRPIAAPGNYALALYSCFGLIMGFLSAGITKLVYYIEDLFEKLPVHWMWWPAIGGVAVGVAGYFDPRTLGVGYENITGLLSGNMTMGLILSLFAFKLLSWSIALGSGTSGGTLAPLLTIGGAAGALLGMAASSMFPHAGIDVTLAALAGMSAMFAGASRALLTSFVFAIETTGQSSALLPLLAACIASYVVSYLIMKNTIMTEKIARRGVLTPHTYAPDILDQVKVKEVVAKQFEHPEAYKPSDKIFLQKKYPVVAADDSLRHAVDIMARHRIEELPVLKPDQHSIGAVLRYSDVLSAYRMYADEHEKNKTIYLKRRTLRMIARGKKRVIPQRTSL